MIIIGSGNESNRTPSVNAIECMTTRILLELS